MRTLSLPSAVLTCALVIGCSSNSDSPSSTAAAGVGGASTAAGGTSSSGGSGGTSSSGGSGGTSSTGGSGGATSAGGNTVSAGGSPASAGGNAASAGGHATAAGGNATGGSPATGGSGGSTSNAGSGGDSTTGGAGGSTASQLVTAKDGGTITEPGITLTIPPGALSADTTVTIATTDKSGQPDATHLASPVFDLGPNGTTFLKPVTITIDFDPTSPPMGTSPVIAFLQNSAWVPLADSAVAGTKVTATTTHFTPYAVFWSSVGGTCTVGSFVACGGDVTGTWGFSALCGEFPPGTDPTGGSCPTATATLAFVPSGTIQFAAGTVMQNYTVTGTEHFTVQKSCFPGHPCSDLSMLFNSSPISNVMDTGTECTCDQALKPSANMSTETYTTSGTQITFASMDVLDYCVSGTTLTAREVTTDPKKVPLVWVAQKQ